MAAMSRRLLLAAAPGLALPAALRAQGAATIRFVVPFAAGGLTDIIARTVAQHMAQTLGQTIVVDNRPGGNAIIASEAVARAPKDGLTVLVGGTAGLPLNVLLRPNLPYRLEDFTPVALLFDGPLSLTINAALPPRDIAGYVSPRDLAQLFTRSIDAPSVADRFGVPFQIFYGVSANARTFWSTTNAREVVGYAPQDDSEVRFADDIARMLARG